jgi:cell division septation protein DedD
MARIFRRAATIGLATTVLSLSIGVAPAFAGAESTFINKVNNARKAAGKAPLEEYWDLTDDARAHSKRMADKQELYHNPNLGSVTTGWKALGENVGVGPDVNSLFNAFMSSSAHKSNILGPYNYIGVGVKVDSNDIMWVTMIFMQHPDDLNGTGGTTTTTTTQPPSTTTTTTQPPSTTTTTKPPSTTTTTKPPSTTTTTEPPSTTTTAAPEVEPFEVPEEELAVLGDDWVSPMLFRLIGRIGR